MNDRKNALKNIAYIDNQNLFMATRTAEEPWMIDMRRFRVYLHEKYDVETAYLFMGAFNPEMQNIYELFQDFGYILVWRLHSPGTLTEKKGNVDTDVVFYMMRDACDASDLDGAVLVSGDGDYCRTVQYLLSKGKLDRVLLPSRHNASSLYKQIPEANKAYLDTASMKAKIGRRH